MCTSENSNSTKLVPITLSGAQKKFAIITQAFNYLANAGVVVFALQTDDLCDLGGLLRSNPAKMESFRKFLASLGDIMPLMSASEAEPLFCAAESASRSYAIDEMSDAISRSILAKNTQKHFFSRSFLDLEAVL